MMDFLTWTDFSERRHREPLGTHHATIPAPDSKLGMKIDGFYRLLDETQGISILEEDERGNMIPQGEVGSLLQVNHSGHAINPQDSLDLLETKNIIAQTIDRLPKNERTVVALYYYEELTMKEIAEIMGNT
jgi:RNA polymerase sigma factor for flagellar operon FliA